MKPNTTIALASLISMTLSPALQTQPLQAQTHSPTPIAGAKIVQKGEKVELIRAEKNAVVQNSTARFSFEKEPARQETLASKLNVRVVQNSTPVRTLEDCTAENPCPPNLKFIGPTPITTYIDGQYNQFKVDVGECDRLTANKEYCLYPEDKLEIGLPKLTAAQKKAGYKVSLWSKDSRIRAAVKDYVITHDEVKDTIFTKEKLFVVLRGPDKKLCASYGLDLTLLACERPVQELIPPTPVVPAPYCGDGIINQVGEQCDGTAGLKPGQVCTGDCTIECPDCVPEQVFVPPPVPQPVEFERPRVKPWSLTPLVDVTNMDVRTIIPNESKYCEAPCDTINILQEFEGPSMALEAAYKRPDLAVAITAFMKELEQQTFAPSRFEQYFADELKTTGLELEVTKSFTDFFIKPFVNIDASITQNDTAKTGVTQAFDPLSAGIYIGPMIGDLDKSHVGVGAGYEVHDEFYRTFAPDFRPGDPATVKFQNPAAKAFGQLTMENPMTIFGKENSFDLFGSYKHHFGEESEDIAGAKLEVQNEWEVGADWMINAGRVDIGPQIRYGETQRDIVLPDFTQEMNSKSIYGGIKIRF